MSWDHAVLQLERGAWSIEDCGSTNGTFAASQKIERLEITGDCTFRFGNSVDGPAMSCSLSRPGVPGPPPPSRVPGPSGNGKPGPSPVETPGPPRKRSPGGDSFHWSRVDVRPSSVVPAPVRTLSIGRAPDNDIVVADLSVSRHHAELRNIGGRYEIADLGSHNGTFLNGNQIVSRAPVTEQDIVGIGQATFRLVGDELREFLDQGDVSLIAQDLTVRSGGRSCSTA